jgi:hypothetical protein
MSGSPPPWGGQAQIVRSRGPSELRARAAELGWRSGLGDGMVIFVNPVAILPSRFRFAQTRIILRFSVQPSCQFMLADLDVVAAY